MPSAGVAPSFVPRAPTLAKFLSGCHDCWALGKGLGKGCKMISAAKLDGIWSGFDGNWSAGEGAEDKEGRQEEEWRRLA